MLGFKKGRQFEKRVESLLELLKDDHPNRIDFAAQPRLRLHDGQIVIPDFNLKVTFPHENQQHFIECQDRFRSKTGIAHKIKYIKGLSNRNTFIFVYRKNIPYATLNALKQDGVTPMSIDDFATWVARLSETLKFLVELDLELINCDIRDRYKEHLPTDCDTRIRMERSEERRDYYK